MPRTSQFDTVHDRRNTGSLKWDNKKNQPGLPDILPLWVADMDFAAPPAVVQAIQARAAHPIYGYTNPPPAYFAALVDWYRTRYGLGFEASDFVLGPAVMPSIAIILRALTPPGSRVVITPPVYYPFFDVVRQNERELVEVPLLCPGPGAWSFDLPALEAALLRGKAEGNPVSAFLLCNPHNPGGKAWTREELAAVDRLCAAHGVLVVSDEIHSDIVFAPRRHCSMADPGFTNPLRLVVAGPNKTFNIAGLHLCHNLVPEPALRTRVARAIAAAGFSQPNAFSITAALAAYTGAAPWLDELLDYLQANFAYLEDFVSRRLGGVRTYRPEATYLAWLDCRPLIARLGLDGDLALASRLEESARVRLSPGSVFGKAEGAGFLRLNVACPRSQLAEGLERLARHLEA